MKKLLISCFLLFFILYSAVAQDPDIEGNLATAKSAYNSGNYEEARFTLQQTLSDLNQIIGEEIQKLLPDEMGGLPAYQEADEMIGNTGMGIVVNRTYQNPDQPDKSVEVSIVDHSPMIAMVNTFLSSPMLSGMMMASSGQKAVKIKGYKGMLEKNVDEDSHIISYTINVPFGDSLLTIETISIDSEKEVIAMSNTIPLDQIVKLVQ
ncbi:MAG: hypothetical protein IIB82_16495 [Bacteroidetes bacterium]|nr:hypothetical protein [Bacteroidota bacterium]